MSKKLDVELALQDYEADELQEVLAEITPEDYAKWLNTRIEYELMNASEKNVYHVRLRREEFSDTTGAPMHGYYVQTFTEREVNPRLGDVLKTLRDQRYSALVLYDPTADRKQTAKEKKAAMKKKIAAKEMFQTEDGKWLDVENVEVKK